MSSYIKKGAPLEFDNAPDWLVGYMLYRRTMLNNTQHSVMTYFKDLRGFFQWASYYKTQGRNPPSAESLHNIDLLAYPVESAVSLQKSDIETYLFFLAETLGNEPATRNKKLASIRSFYDYILDHQDALGVELAGNPSSRIKSPKTPKKQPVYLTESDQNILLQSIQGKNAVRDRAIFLTLLTTGMRISELEGLDVNDLNLEYNSVLIRHGKGSKERIAYLTELCRIAIEDYLTQYRNLIPGLDTKALFISKRSKTRLTTRSIERAMEKYVHIGKLRGKNYTPHKLRHSTATTLAKDGKSPMIIKEILGHESISTSQLYMHLDNTDIMNAVNTSSLNTLGHNVKEEP